VHHTLEVKDLHFSYPDGREALRGVDFFIAPGEKVALVGPNGAGKSTLLLHINGILEGEGEIWVCGVRLEKETMKRIRASVGMVFDNPDDQLFSPTVFDDVAFGPIYMGFPAEEVSSRVEVALSAVGVRGFEDRLSHHLSTGEKKRVSIATVLSMDPEILVMDEPTAGLDPRGRREFMLLLATLPQTMLVSTHDMSMVEHLFPRMLVIDEGQIVADGATNNILADEALLERHGLESPLRVNR
jgi:cobalt transport protein ATP-binding subunit